jgi:hypothetical protein
MSVFQGAAMLPDGARLWKLSDGGPASLGVSCTPDGLFLGGTALVERRGARYSVRSQRDVERLLLRAYGSSEIAIERLMPRLGSVAAALGERNLCLAQIAALHLCLPDLFDPIARAALEAEDTVLKASRQDESLARSGWDPAEHPRAGVPPNLGWFATTGGEIAQNEEDERALEEPTDHLAQVRQELWDASIARLREIDPHNPQLSYLTAPDTAPSQAALDRLYAALEAACCVRGCRDQAGDRFCHPRRQTDRETRRRSRHQGGGRRRDRRARCVCLPARRRRR